jgi:hypothetical protein
MEVLTAYVRQYAPRRPEEAQKGTEDAAEAKSAMEDSGGTSETTEGPPDPNIHAIMTVLRRRTRSFGHGEPERIDLHETHLTGADLQEANLRGAILTQEQLEETTGDENIKLPPHLTSPAHWGVKTDEQIEED